MHPKKVRNIKDAVNEADVVISSIVVGKDFAA
jgi:hypothetical protein